MTIEEAKKVFGELQTEGHSKEDIAGALYLMFQNGELDITQLEALVNELGFAMDDKFKAMSPEDQKTKGWAPKEDEEPTEPSPKDESQSSQESQTPPPSNDGNESNENDEKKKAMKMFGLR